MPIDTFSIIISYDKYVGNVQPCTPLLLPAGQLRYVSYCPGRPDNVSRNIMLLCLHRDGEDDGGLLVHEIQIHIERAKYPIGKER